MRNEDTHTKHWVCHSWPLELTIFSWGSKLSPHRVQAMAPRDMMCKLEGLSSRLKVALLHGRKVYVFKISFIMPILIWYLIFNMHQRLLLNCHKLNFPLSKMPSLIGNYSYITIFFIRNSYIGMNCSLSTVHCHEQKNWQWIWPKESRLVI